MKIEVPPNKRSNYYDIRTNGETGRDDKAQKLVSIGSQMEYMAKQHRKTKFARKDYKL